MSRVKFRLPTFSIARFAALGVLASVMTGCATGSPSAARAPTLREVAREYENACVGGQRESNNCAHFLSNAFIEAGFDELMDDPAITTRCRCRAGRPIRAQEMLAWFQQKADRFHAGYPPDNTGLWAVYQEKPGRRHVVLIDTDKDKFYGTANCVNWPVQWAYQW